MTSRELMNTVQRIVDNVKTGILATVDPQGRPHMRWMMPAILDGRPGAIFAVTSPHFAKIFQVQANPQAEWMIQTRGLDEIVNVQGRINIVDNPSLKMEVLEAVGRRLAAFWKTCAEDNDCVILETVAEQALYLQPMKGIRQVVHFTDESLTTGSQTRPGLPRAKSRGRLPPGVPRGPAEGHAADPPLRGEGRATVRPPEDRRLLPPVHRPGGRRRGRVAASTSRTTTS